MGSCEMRGGSIVRSSPGEVLWELLDGFLRTLCLINHDKLSHVVLCCTLEDLVPLSCINQAFGRPRGCLRQFSSEHSMQWFALECLGQRMDQLAEVPILTYFLPFTFPGGNCLRGFCIGEGMCLRCG